MRLCECGARIHITPHPSRNKRSGGRLSRYQDHDLCRRCFRQLINKSKLAARASEALGQAEDLMSGEIEVNEAYEGEVENIAVDLRRCGERDLIASYALVGEEAPPELLAHHVILDDTLSALRRIISGELPRIGYLGLWCVYTSKYTLSVDDLRSSQGDTPSYKVNIGRLLEELLREPTGAGAEGVIRAVKRAQGPYADQLEESHYED